MDEAVIWEGTEIVEGGAAGGYGGADALFEAGYSSWGGRGGGDWEEYRGGYEEWSDRRHGIA